MAIRQRKGMLAMWNTPINFLTNQINVHLVGCGGTGSFVLAELSQLHELLSRLGHPGLHVTAWDGSPVRDANLGRQRFRVHDLGKGKAQASIEAENAYNGFGWEYRGDYSGGALGSNRPTILITAVDKPSVRQMIGRRTVWAKSQNALWIDAGNDHKTGQVIVGGAGLPCVYDLFKSQYDSLTDNDAKSCSSEEALAKQDFGVNSTAARLVGQLMWNMLRHGMLERHGAFFDVATLTISPLPVSKEVWLSFGWRE